MLELQLHSRSERYLAGQGVLLDLTATPRADMTLDTPELNNSRSTLHLQRDGDAPLSLAGADHARLHGLNPLQALGQTLPAAAGQPVESVIELLQFTPPLAPGRWRARLAYRWGSSADEVALSNEVGFVVEPGQVRSARWRWFAGATPRGRLEGVWSSHDGKSLRWFYQASSGRDPAAVQFCSDLRLSTATATTPPELALLHGLAGSQFERYVLWLQPGALLCAKVSAFGRMAEPVSVAHDLGETVQLASPALQTAQGGLQAVLVGAQASLRVSLAPGGAVALQRLPGLPGAPVQQVVALWPADGGAATLFARRGRQLLRIDAAGAVQPIDEAPGEILRLVDDQSASGARLLWLWRDGQRLGISSLDGRARGARPQRQAPITPASADAVVDATATADGLALLWRDQQQWLVRDGRRGERRLPAAGAHGWLVVDTAGNIHLLDGDDRLRSRRLPSR